ncbi:MAG TPA: long-chain fatty acid--CoA ligase [Kofleriaceae bacterium]|jgi:long-chain acyl-CoA synthetase|nr:long-chain fatty acid--CoA ligase [Kofleriaceae bacterium]
MTRDTIPHRVLRMAADRPSTIAYQAKVNGRWQPTTWKTYGEQIRAAARAMMALGLPRGGKVSILGFNRPEWAIVDHAAMMAGGCPAGIYTTCSPEEVQYIIHHSESVIALVENADQLAKVKAKRSELPLLKWIVMMKGATDATGGDVLTWEDFLAKGDGTTEAELDKRIDSIEQSDLATLIYTSGTTGPPKGVMLSHKNLAWTSRALWQLGGQITGEVMLSYLPLSHIAEQMCSLHMPATGGHTVYFAESIDKVPDNLKDARPTVFFGVPRIWEKFHAALAGKLGETTGAKKALVDWARKVCREVNVHRDRGEAVPMHLELQYRLANRVVISKIKQAVGLDRAHELFSGAAPIAADVLEFFSSLDMPIHEIYGQSEDSGPTSCNIAGKTKIGSVGPSIPGIEVKLGEDGEILIRGPNVFLGYYKEPEATAETLKDGWLCSGDLGAFDRDGFLSITGRKKEIIITAGGKNIAPKNIEALIKQSPLVGEAVVIGDRRKFLTALVTLEPTTAGDLPKDQIRSQIQVKIDEINQQLARVEQIKKFAILEKPFGIDSGELTPTMKIKRKVVAQKYASEIEAMYVEDAN